MLKVSLVNLSDELKESSCECQSPYHWLYDWFIPERDRRELHMLLDAHVNGNRNEGTIDVVMRELANPKHKYNIDLTASQLADKTSGVRESVTPFRIRKLVNGEPLWESTIILGRHGCWLCDSCCMLEQLFPTKGVGSPGNPNFSSLEELINGSWYTCSYPEHEVTPRALFHTFRGELLVACLARHKLKETLRYRKSIPSLVELGEIVESCFGDSRLSKEEKDKEARLSKRTTYLKDDVAEEMETLFEVDELLDEMLVSQEGDLTKEELDAHGKRLSAYALSNIPPYADKVPQHKPFSIPDRTVAERHTFGITWSTFSDNPKLQINPFNANLSITKRRERAYEEILKDHDGLKTMDSTRRFQADDSLTMTRERRAGETVWQIKRSDPVTYETRQWITRQGPATPPRTPPNGEKEQRHVVVPSFTLADERTERLPEWYKDTVLPYKLGSTQPKTKRDMISMPADEDGKAIYDLVTLSTKIPCSELYAMTRLRRARDKLDEWTRQGYTEQQIQQQFVAQQEALEDKSDTDEVVPEENEEFYEGNLHRSLSDSNRRGTLYRSGYEYMNKSWKEEDQARQEQIEEEVELRKAMLETADKKMNVIEECQVCYSDFAVWFCPQHNKSYCEACYEGIHQFGADQAHRKYKLAPQPKMSHLAEEGGVVLTRSRDVYTVAVLVVIFLIYPSLIKEIALMLNCTDRTCVDSETCHPFLVVDPSIECTGDKYTTYKFMSFVLFFGYGFGLPLGGWIMLYRNLSGLRTKEVMSTLGFLYAGYRQKRWYWEMVIMIRKMFIVFIVVFLARNAEHQIWAAMWTTALFLFLNVMLRPFKFSILWILENISLMCLMLTLNLALFYFADLTDSAKSLLTWSIVGFNVLVLLTFVFFIVRDLIKEITNIVDSDGDGNISCDEAKDYLTNLYDKNKPNCLRTRQDVLDDIERVERRRKWLGIDMMQRRFKQKQQPDKTLDCTASYGYWKEIFDSKTKGENRFKFLERKNDSHKATVTHQRKQLSMNEITNAWGVVYGEFPDEERDPGKMGFVFAQSEVGAPVSVANPMSNLDAVLPDTPSVNFGDELEYSPAAGADEETL